MSEPITAEQLAYEKLSRVNGWPAWRTMTAEARRRAIEYTPDLVEEMRAVLAAAPSPPVSVEQAGKATAEQIEAAIIEFTRVSNMVGFLGGDREYRFRQSFEAAINAALQLSVSPVQETKEEAR